MPTAKTRSQGGATSAIGRLERLGPADRAAAIGLVDRCMRPGVALSMAEDFPLLVGEGARSNRMVMKDAGQVVSHAAAVTLEADLPNGRSLRLLNVGAVCTDPAARGRGYARALVEALMTEGRRTDHDAAILWTSDGGFYEPMGYVEVGHEVHFRVLHADVVDDDGTGVVDYDERRLEALLALRRRDPLPIRRERQAAGRLFRLPLSRTWIAADRDESVAYLTLGKGLDFEGTVHEWAGPAEALPGMLNHVFQSTGLSELSIIGPAHHRGFESTFAIRGCERVDRPVAMMCVLDAARLVARIEGVAKPRSTASDPQSLLCEVFGTPGSRRSGKLPLPFWIPGLDSN